MLDTAPDNIHCNVACAVQIFNIKHIIDFAKWKLSKGYKRINKFTIDDYQAGGGIISLHLLYIPTFLSARLLPKEDKEQLVKDFENFKEWLWNNYTQDDNFWHVNPYGWKRWQGILNFVTSEDHSNLLPDLKEYVNNLDDIRKTDAKSVFPELSHLF